MNQQFTKHKRKELWDIFPRKKGRTTSALTERGTRKNIISNRDNQRQMRSNMVDWDEMSIKERHKKEKGRVKKHDISKKSEKLRNGDFIRKYKTKPK